MMDNRNRPASEGLEHATRSSQVAEPGEIAYPAGAVDRGPSHHAQDEAIESLVPQPPITKEHEARTEEAPVVPEDKTTTTDKAETVHSIAHKGRNDAYQPDRLLVRDSQDRGGNQSSASRPQSGFGNFWSNILGQAGTDGAETKMPGELPAKTFDEKLKDKRQVGTSGKPIHETTPTAGVRDVGSVGYNLRRTIRLNTDEMQDRYSLTIISTVPAAQLPYVDIVAVHDLEESLQTAWIYTLEKSSARTFSKYLRDSEIEPGIDGHDGKRASIISQIETHDEPRKRRNLPRDKAIVERTHDATGNARMETRNTHDDKERDMMDWISKNAVAKVPSKDDTVQWRSSTIPLHVSTPVVTDERQHTLLENQSKETPATNDKNAKGTTDTNITRKSRIIKTNNYTTSHRLTTDSTSQKCRPVDQGETESVENAAHDKPQLLENPHSSPQSTDIDGEQEKKESVHWLRDPNMIPGGIPNSRILAYSYPSLGQDTRDTPVDYLRQVAQELITRLNGKRSPDYTRVPIVFIAHGFGCLVLQRAIALAAAEDSGENQNPYRNILRLIAGIIFLDAPPTTFRNSLNKTGAPPNWPRSQTAEKRWVVDWLRKKKIDTEALWNDFERQHQGMLTVWFYKAVRKQSSIEPNVPGVLFIPLKSDESQRLTRFRHPNDTDYKQILHQIKSCLLFKASTMPILEDLLAEFIKHKFPVNAADSQGRSPLHQAASTPNDAAVKRLVNAGGAMVGHKDKAGLTPLHLAVLKAVVTNPLEERSRRRFKDVIGTLLTNTLNIDELDGKKLSAWDYAQGESFKWIRELKDQRGLIWGASKSTINKPLEDLDIPKVGQKQYDACQNFEAVLVEFYLEENEGEIHDLLDYQRTSVFGLIYDKENGPQKILSRARRQETRSGCRWMHIPANNEQWVHDLFIRLHIEDDSMIGQRHQGSSSFDRYMLAQATKYQHTYVQHNQDGVNAICNLQRDAIVLFMPILGFERHQRRKDLTKAITSVTSHQNVEEKSDGILLIEAYLEAEKPLHCRRTLDQFFYYMLETTEPRDKDQVIYRWARKQKSGEAIGERPILMVDQLWLWVLHDGTVITSFPNTWELKEPYNLRMVLEDELRQNKKRHLIKSTDDLIHWIIKATVDFFRREGPCEISFQECFQSSINNIAEKQASLFKRFKNIGRYLSDVHLDADERASMIEEFFVLNKEAKLLVEIMDIQDELNTVKSVLVQQKETLEKLLHLYPSQDDQHNPRSSRDNEKELLLKVLRLFLNKHDGQSESHSSNGEHLHNQGGFDHPNPTLLKNHALVHENISIVNDNISVVTEMTDYARKLQIELKHLLDLKQKQANAWEARFARERSEQTRRQGNIILMFTIVTILFLPLSFMSSFFDLPVNEFPKNASGNTAWSLNQLSSYLFGISIAFSVPFILGAIYVNRITSIATMTLKRLSGSCRSSRISITDDEDSENEDAETEYDTDYDSDDRGYREEESDNIEDKAVVFLRDNYAPLFGRWMFHTNIPLLRRLWEYRWYLQPGDDDDSEYLWNETYKQNYPLRHGLSKIYDLWRPRRLLPHEIGYKSDVESDDSITRARGILRVVRRRSPQRPYSEHSLNISHPTNIASSFTTSGYHRRPTFSSDERLPAVPSRTGASFFEPVRRMFVRRRAQLTRRDVENASF